MQPLRRPLANTQIIMQNYFNWVAFRICFPVAKPAVPTIAPCVQLVVTCKHNAMELATRYLLQWLLDKLANNLGLLDVQLRFGSLAALVILIFTPSVQLAFLVHSHTVVLATCYL